MVTYYRMTMRSEYLSCFLQLKSPYSVCRSDGQCCMIEIERYAMLLCVLVLSCQMSNVINLIIYSPSCLIWGLDWKCPADSLSFLSLSWSSSHLTVGRAGCETEGWRGGCGHQAVCTNILTVRDGEGLTFDKVGLIPLESNKLNIKTIRSELSELPDHLEYD